MNIAFLSTMIILSGYFIGSLHGSSIAQWLSGVKVKEHGVKNSGASNATIVLGWKYGVLVALVDIGKGLITILLLHYFLHSTALIIDHIFNYTPVVPSVPFNVPAIYDYAHPIYFSTPSDPLFSIHCTANYGICDLEGIYSTF